MREQHEELIQQLHELADWVEKNNSVHSHSVTRKAAYVIYKLQEENYQYRLRLNKTYVTIGERINRVIGMVRLWIYLMRKKWKKG